MTDSNYLLLGPELGEKKEFIKNLKKKLEKKYSSPPEEYSFYPYDTETADIISILQNISLFSASKLVIINNFTEIKKKDIDLITGYLKNPADDTFLVLTDDGLRADAKIEKQIPPPNKKIFWEMFENKKKSWIVNFFRRENIEIDSSAVDFLTDMLESSTDVLADECGKLIRFFNPGDRITEESIESFFYDRKEENIFSLFDRLAGCDLQKSIETAKNVFLSGESSPVQMLSGLLWQLRNLYELKKLTDERKPFQEACQLLRIRSKKMQKTFQTALKNYSLSEIESLISMIAEFDIFFRNTRQDIQHIIFPLFIYYFIEKKGKEAVSLIEYTP